MKNLQICEWIVLIWFTDSFLKQNVSNFPLFEYNLLNPNIINKKHKKQPRMSYKPYSSDSSNKINPNNQQFSKFNSPFILIFFKFIEK